MARVLISMKDDFLKRIDEVARREQRTRSELIREALRAYIRKGKTLLTAQSERDARNLELLLD